MGKAVQHPFRLRFFTQILYSQPVVFLIQEKAGLDVYKRQSKRYLRRSFCWKNQTGLWPFKQKGTG